MKIGLLFLAGLFTASAVFAETNAVKQSAWNGYTKLDFTVGGRAALLTFHVLFDRSRWALTLALRTT